MVALCRVCGKPLPELSRAFCSRKCFMAGRDCRRGGYLPTPEQIKAVCLAIQASWTPEQEVSRREGYGDPVPADTRVIRSKDMFA